MTAATIDLRQDVPIEENSQFFKGLGSFWTDKFQDSAVVKVLVSALQDRFNQAQIGLEEDIATATSISQAPLFSTEAWRYATLYQADASTENPNTPYYNEANGFYGAGLIYGQGIPTLWSWPVPPELVDPACITSSPEAPEYIAYRNQGFYYAKGILGFRVNPFADPRFVVQNTDRGPAVRIWYRVSRWDRRKIARQYGVPLGIPALPSTESYRMLCEGAWESRVRGSSNSALYKIISGASGVPLCLSDGEIVEVITTAPNGDHVVVTDKNSYRFPASHTVTATVGTTMYEGQEFTAQLKVRHPASMTSGQEDITLLPGFFNRGVGLQNPLRFPNSRVPVTPGGLDVNGNREISFNLVGDGSDIKKYRKAANAAKIYKALDTRGPNASTVPTAAQIKATVNPAIDLIAKHTKPHLILLYGDPSKWPAPPQQQALLFSQADKFIPVHGRLIMQPRTSSNSYSSQSYRSSSSSSPSNSMSSRSSKSSPSSPSSLSSRSSLSTRSSGSTPSSRSSLSSWGTRSSSSSSKSSRSSQSKSSQSFSSRSTQSLSSKSTQSQSSHSSASSGSTPSSPSSMSSQSRLSSQSSNSSSSHSPLSSQSLWKYTSQSHYYHHSASSRSSQSTFKQFSTSSKSSKSTFKQFSTSSKSSKSSDSSSSSYSLRTLQSTQSISSQSYSTQTISTQSSKSESSLSRSFSSASSPSSRSDSSRSSRSESTQSRSSRSSPSSRSSQSLSSLSDQTIPYRRYSTSSSSSSTASLPRCGRPLPYSNTTKFAWSTLAFYDGSYSGSTWIWKRFTNSTASPIAITVSFHSDGYPDATYWPYYCYTTNSPCTGTVQYYTSIGGPAADFTSATMTIPAGATYWFGIRSYSGGNWTAATTLVYLTYNLLLGSSSSSKSSASSKSSVSGPPYGTRSATSVSPTSKSTKSSRSSPSSKLSSQSTFKRFSTSSRSSKSTRSSDSSKSHV